MDSNGDNSETGKDKEKPAVLLRSLCACVCVGAYACVAAWPMPLAAWCLCVCTVLSSQNNSDQG